MFLAATWHHIVITTGGFHQMSVEVLGLAFIYFSAHSPSAKRASLNCLFNDAQRIEWWMADVVCLELQNANKHAFSVSVSCVFVVCRSSVVCFGRFAETAPLLSAKQTKRYLILCLR